MKLLVRRGEKLAPFLKGIFAEKYSCKMIRRVLEANLCRVNGHVERFGSASLCKGDIVELASAWEAVAAQMVSEGKPFFFTTLYENDGLLFVDKPAGWVCSEENCRRTFGLNHQLIHRLDKDTTGVLAIAKLPKLRDELMALFAQRAVKKEYLAIIDGMPKNSKGVQKSHFVKKRSIDGQTIWGSGSSGPLGITEWETLATGKTSALLLCRPITGRTHQIRVHLAEMGHPILVDRQYASHFRCPVFASRPLLHSYRLRLGEYDVHAPLPVDMQQQLDLLGIERDARVFLSGKSHMNPVLRNGE